MYAQHTIRRSVFPISSLIAFLQSTPCQNGGYFMFKIVMRYLASSFRAKGRIGRAQFCGYFFPLSIVTFGVNVVIIMQFVGWAESAWIPPNRLFVNVIYFTWIVLWYVIVCTTIKRLHDCNRTGWHVLWGFGLHTMILPTLFFVGYCCFKKGDKHENRYG